MTDQSRTFNYGVFWEEEYGYSQAVRVGSTIYISGQLAHDAEGNFIGEGDFKAQLDAAFENLDKVLAHFGASRSQVVEDTVMVVGLQENFDELVAAHKAYFGDHRPASTAFGVTALAFPEQLFEIAATVRLDVGA